MLGKKVRIQLGLVILVAILLVLASQGWMLRKSPNSATPLSVFSQATETGHTLPREPLFHYSGYQPEVRVKDGPLDAYADKIFMMLKTGATVTQSRLPPHIRSTLKRWPHHAVYADVETEVCGVPVIDILKWLPQDLVERHCSHLGKYFELREALESKWLWELDDINDYPGWILDKYKNVPMLAHAWLNAPASTEWFVFIDADSYVLQRGLLEHLKSYNYSEPHYIGRAADWTFHVNNKHGEEISIQFAHGGSGVAISRGAMSALFGADPHSDRGRMGEVLEKFMDLADPNIAGDALVGMMLYMYVDELLVEVPWGNYPCYDTPFQGSTTRDVAVGPNGWCLPLISWHHLNPSEIDLLYDYEQTIPMSKSHVTFADIYRDFIMPYVVDERSDWNAIMQHTEGRWEEKTSRVFTGDNAASSKEACKQACVEEEKCLLWVFEWGRCQLELGVLYRGAAINSKKKGFWKSVTSGWMVDRIREKRLSVECDPLHKLANGTWSDHMEMSEGYMY